MWHFHLHNRLRITVGISMCHGHCGVQVYRWLYGEVRNHAISVLPTHSVASGDIEHTCEVSPATVVFQVYFACAY